MVFWILAACKRIIFPSHGKSVEAGLTPDGDRLDWRSYGTRRRMFRGILTTTSRPGLALSPRRWLGCNHFEPEERPSQVGEEALGQGSMSDSA